MRTHPLSALQITQHIKVLSGCLRPSNNLLQQANAVSMSSEESIYNLIP
jgi:hypothetical protein